jgi:hypothetical protein
MLSIFHAMARVTQNFSGLQSMIVAGDSSGAKQNPLPFPEPQFPQILNPSSLLKVMQR